MNEKEFTIWVKSEWDANNNSPYHITDQINNILLDIEEEYYRFITIIGGSGYGKDAFFNYFAKNHDDFDYIVNLKSSRVTKDKVFCNVPDYRKKKDLKERLYDISSYFSRTKVFVLLINESFLPLLKSVPIWSKMKVFYLEPYSIEDMIEIYKLVDSGFKFFTLEAVRIIARMSYGNPREFKKIMSEYMREERPVHASIIKDKSIKFIVDIELGQLYSSNNISLDKLMEYYDEVSSIVKHGESRGIRFNSQTLLLKYAENNNIITNSRRVSNCVKPIKEKNNLSTGRLNYDHLMYIDEGGFFKLP